MSLNLHPLHRDDYSEVTHFRFQTIHLIRFLVRYWYVFLASIILFAGIGKWYVWRKPMGRMEFFMTVATRMPHEVVQPTQYPDLTEADRQEIGAAPMGRKTSPWSPEFAAGLFNSTSVLEIAGLRCNFQVEYQAHTSRGMQDVYNQTPIVIEFLDLAPEDDVTGVVHLNTPEAPQRIILRGLRGTYHAVYQSQEEEVECIVGDTVQTKLGAIVVRLDDYTQHYPVHIPQTFTEIAIHRHPLLSSRYLYDSNLEVSMVKLGEGVSSSHIRIQFAAQGSERRSMELLRTMYEVVDSLAWRAVIEDLHEPAPAELVAAAQVGTGEAERYRQTCDTLAIPPVGVSPLRIIDVPRVRYSYLPDLFVIVGMAILGLLLPLFALYIYWVIRGAIYSPGELPLLWRERLRGDLSLRGGRRREGQAEELRGIFSQLGGDASSTTLLWVTPTATSRHDKMVSALVNYLHRVGDQSMVIWTFYCEGDDASVSRAGVVAQPFAPGFIGSAAFHEQLGILHQQYRQVVLVPPATSRSEAAYLLAPSASGVLCSFYRGCTRVTHVKRSAQALVNRTQLDPARWYTIWVA